MVVTYEEPDVRKFIAVDDGEVASGDAAWLVHHVEGDFIHNLAPSHFFVVENNDIRPLRVTTRTSNFNENDYAAVTVKADGVEVGCFRLDLRS